MTKMADPSKSNKCQAEYNYGRTVDQDLELWKHHASTGGKDKDRMVTIASWLLGFSAVILWYIVTNLIVSKTLELREPKIAILTAVLGIGVSILALYISLLYGGYSNQNWGKADKIACCRKWCDLLPSTEPSPRHDDRHKAEAEPTREQQNLVVRLYHRLHLSLNRLAKRWARPCDPTKRLAPVFIVFLGLATFSLLLHLWFVWCSISGILLLTN
jgi:hypothetical protein